MRSDKTLAGQKKQVKPAKKARSPQTAAEKRSEAAKKAAATRKREAEFRARVAHERAKEQRAKALADKRRAAKELQERIEFEQAMAGVELANAQELARQAEAKELTAKEAHAVRVKVQQAELEVDIAERAVRAEAASEVQEIRTGRELLEEQIQKYYARAKEEEKILPLSARHPSGKTWRHESRVRSGGVVDRKVGRFLREDTLESMTRRLVKAAVKAKALQPNGKLYVSFSIVEYGRNVPKSPGPAYYRDAIGTFYQAYEGTADLTPASDIAGFEAQIRSILEMRLRDSGSSNAIMIDSFQVKSYYERTDAEQRAFVTARRRARSVMCLAKHPDPARDIHCTRQLGHEGSHIARGLHGELIAKWKQQ